MKVLMVHVGDPVSSQTEIVPDKFIQMESLELGKQWFRVKDVVNAVTQMESLKKAGVDIDYVFLTERRSLSKLWRAGLRLREFVRKRRFDLVHVLWGSSAGFMVSCASPVPTIVSFCGSDLLGNYNQTGAKTMSGRISLYLSQLAALLSKRVITKSAHMKESLWSVSQKKCSVIPNGVDLDTFFPIDKLQARHELQWHPTEKVILFFHGSGDYVKNRPLAEQAFQIVREKLEGCRLEVVVDVPYSRLNLYYNAADLMLLASYHEGSNNSVKEAMACNLPIVSTDCGDTRERLEGVTPSAVVGQFDTRLLAEKSFEILRRGARSNAREKVQAISLDNVAQLVINEYRAVYES
jgi:teichuronic acid biosynthesis glycosyltransferase TuaC